MHNVTLAFEAAWKVLLVGLVLGAGLPALFAVGVRSMAHGQGADGAAAVGPGARSASRLFGAACFVLVIAAVALGIAFIVVTGQGKSLSFDNGFPEIVSKH
jgi:hypothetical protein